MYAVAFSPDSQWLASGGREWTALGTLREKAFGRPKDGRNGRTIRLWRVRDGALVQTLSEHTGDVHGLDFSRDGQWMASSSDDKTVRLWALDRSEKGKP